jgi:hypothetical protein
MAFIRINLKMVEALGMTIEINGRQAMIMSHPKTQAALAVRGLADENGYLTDWGLYVAWLLGNGSPKRTWTSEMLEDLAPAWIESRKRDRGDA